MAVLNLAELTTQVERQEQVTAGAVVLIQGLAAEIASVAGDVEATNALADRLRVDADVLGAAVAANTPGQPPV